MIFKNYSNFDLLLKKNIHFILRLFFLMVIIIFFLKSLNVSLFWFDYFKASYNGIINEKIFWDFEVYKCAASKLVNNANPYVLLTDCMPSKKPFIHNYPILSTFIFIPFVSISFFWSKFIWGCLLLFSFIAFIFFQKKLFNTKIHYLIYSFIILFCLDKAVIYSLFTGNISFILQILLACSFYFLYKKKLNFFFIIIFLVSCFKFYFLIFAICPFFLWKFEYKKQMLITTIALIIFYITNYLYDPVLFNNWIENIFKASVAKNYYDGFGIGSLKYIINFNNFLESNNIIKFGNRELIEILFTLIYLIILICIGYYFLNLDHTTEKNLKIKVAFSILLIAAGIPRLEVYDLIVFISPIIFLLEKFYNFKKVQDKYMVILSFLFISVFLLNGDSGITYPFLLIFTMTNLYFYKKNLEIK